MLMQRRKPENDGTLFREQWKEKCRKRTRTRMKHDLLKESRKWIDQMENVKRKLNNMERVQIKYWEMDIWKVNYFNFLNEEAD